ncbi:thiamine pyrophosphate-binding protein [Streptomyces werraensis]|uniref:thiamine pyrophosphate-binding protein n=1 Tax=Streptomyces werraensis TaxID=68284 RepID=UPI00380190E8
MSTIVNAVTDALVAEDTDTVFSLMGDGNLELLAGLSATGRVSLVHAVHEQGAVAMADGYARFSGRPGVASVTHGPGLTNTGTSLLTAVAARSPVVLLAPDTPTGDLNHPQRVDQHSFVRSTGAYFRPLHRPGTVHADVQAVFRHVRSGAGPAVLNAPTDVLRAPLPAEAGSYVPAPGRPAGPAPAPAALAAAADALAVAERPVLLVGRGIDPDTGVAAVADLADLLGAPIVTTLKAKGLLARHPSALGVAGGLGPGPGTRALTSADCVVIAGASANGWTTDGGTVLTGSTVIHIDTDAEAIGRHAEADVAVVADAPQALRQLCERLRAAGHRPVSNWMTLPVPETTPPETALPDATPGTVHPQHAVEALDAALPENRLLVVDAGHFGSYAQQTLRSFDPRAYTFSHDCGAIGQALGIGIGAAVARPGERVTVVLGDGCLVMSLAELSTLARYRLPVTLLVMDDRGYGQERHSLAAKGYPVGLSEHPWPDLVSVARGFGIPAHGLSDARDLATLPRLLADADGPQLINVQIDPAFRNRAFADIAARLR